MIDGSWREHRNAAVRVGARNGGWCLGSSSGLMAALFTLGVMSLAWMALVAGLVALQKLAPWRRASAVATVGVLTTLAVAVLAAPRDVPGVVVPTAQTAMSAR